MVFLFRHLNTLAIAFVWSLLAALIVLAVYPRTYSSEAKLLVKVGRESVSLDPTATTSETISLQKTQEEEVNSALEVFTSRQVYESAVDQLGVDAVLDGQLNESDSIPQSSLTRWLGNAKEHLKDLAYSSLSAVRDPISDRERAVTRVQDTVSIWSHKKSTVITVYAESKTPKMAQAIAQALVDAYLDQHLIISQTSGSLDFFSEQSVSSQSRLRKLIADQSAFMKRKGIVSVDATRSILTDKLVSNERVLFDYRDRLEIEERDLAAELNESHPKLREVRKRLAEVNDVLTESEIPSPKSGAPQQTLVSRRSTNSKVKKSESGMRGLFESKAAQRAEILDKLEKLAHLELQLDEMDRGIAVASSSALLHKQKLEEARLIREQQNNRISNVNVFQPANFIEKPANPKKALVGTGILLLGMGSALCLALWREHNDSSLKTARDVQSNLNVPVVAQVPDLGRRRNLLLHRGSQEALRMACKEAILDLVHSQSQDLKDEPLGVLVGVLGCEAGCGSSTVAAAIASVCSVDLALKTVLVNTDSNAPNFGKNFSLNGAPGLSEILAEEASFEDCLQSYAPLNLGVVASAAPDRLATTKLNTPLLHQHLQKNRHLFDITVVDLPPADDTSQPIPLAYHLDSVFVVVESDHTDIEAAQRVIKGFHDAKANVNGIVLNRFTSDLPSWLIPS